LTAEIEALALTATAEYSVAAAAWQTALDAAEADTDFLMAVRGLAHTGGDLPDLTEMEQQHPQMVNEIRTIQRAIGAGGGTIEALRAGANEHPALAVLLAERYGQDGTAAHPLEGYPSGNNEAPGGGIWVCCTNRCTDLTA
jgi:hypothetical protein